MSPRFLHRPWHGPDTIAASVVLISLLHYSVSVHIAILHEIFKRLYYVPVVAAAVLYGARGGLATAVLASLLYLPHIVVAWSAWPIVELNQYGELVLFNVVALITGVLADRLRTERDRYQRTAAELQTAYADLETHAQERFRVDRLVTIGRLASGVAHEIRNPLGGLLGCLEILQVDFPQAHPKHEFLTIARKEATRLDGVVTGFLEFAQPARPSRRAVDLCDLVRSTGRLARSSLGCRQIELALAFRCDPIVVEVDPEQLQRAFVNIVLEIASFAHGTRLQVTVDVEEGQARVDVEAEGVEARPDFAAQLFEPYSSADDGHGLALATARRLVENQGGTADADVIANTLRCSVRLPASERTPVLDRQSEADLAVSQSAPDRRPS